jgi:hypothetical protein
VYPETLGKSDHEPGMNHPSIASGCHVKENSMAKNWTINEETGVMERAYGDGQPALTVSMDTIYPMWTEFNEVQKCNAINGLKQKMDDFITRSKDEKLNEKEKREQHLLLWERLTVEQKWNATTKGGTRGPSVSLKALIPAINEFIQMGYSIEKIAGLIDKPVDLVKRYVEDDETTEE